MSKIRISVLVILVSIICFSQANAANTSEDLKNAQEMLKENESAKALELLVNNHDPASTNAQEWFLMGMAAKADNRPRQAQIYFEKVVELAPENSGRAKLELAQLSYSLGDAKKAKSYLQEVKAAKPPEKVGENIDSFLQIIESRGTPQKWHFNISAGWMHDSNANAGPDTDTVLLYGWPFTLSNDAKESSDYAWLYKAGFRYSTDLSDNMGWQTSLFAGYTDYSKINSLDSLVFAASTGPSFRVTNKFAVSTPIVVDQIKYGHDDPWYSNSLGLAPQFRYAFLKDLFLNVNTAISKKAYYKRSEKNSDNLLAAPSLGYQINKNSFVSAGLSFGYQDANLSIYDNALLGANAMYGHVFWDVLQINLYLSYADTDYREREAAYDEARHDKTTRFGISADYYIKQINAGISASVFRTINNSNLDLYEYDRDQFTISLRKSF